MYIYPSTRRFSASQLYRDDHYEAMNIREDINRNEYSVKKMLEQILCFAFDPVCFLGISTLEQNISNM